MIDIKIHQASIEDIAAIIEVEKTGYDYPWSEQVFRDCFKPSYLFLVAELDEEIIGYTIISDIVGEAHLLNICIHKNFYRQGIAKRLLKEGIDKSRLMSCESMLLEVRESNSSAIALYQSFGFNLIGRRKNYYPGNDGREDALMYQMDLLGIEDVDTVV